MNAPVLLAGMLLGQLNCSTGSCSLVQPPSFLLAYVEPAYAVQRPATPIPMLKRYDITHEGLSLTVEGWVIPGNNGGVTWEPSRPFNTRALADARADRAAKLAARKPDPKPTGQVADPPRRKANPRNFTDENGVLNVFPIDEPAIPKATGEIGQVAGQVKNYGLSPEKMTTSKGYTAHSEEARRFVAEATGPAQSEPAKLHLTVIGADDARKAVLADLQSHPALAPYRDGLMIQDYKPGEWAVDPKLGFENNGKPAIVIQAGKSQDDPAGGRVIWRSHDYSMGPEGLAEAIRKNRPNYDPKLDPGPATGKDGGLCPLGFTKDHWPVIAIVAALVLVVIVRLPRKEG